MLTVRDVLGLDVLSGSHVKVVAGGQHLDREVRWVHAGEVSDIATFLRGGELLLTAGTGIGSTAEQQQRYVKELAEVGVSGLVLELGRAFSGPPAGLCEEAEERALPVATLGVQTPFADVTRRVHAMILDRQYELLEKAEQIGRQFTDLLLRGGGVEHVVGTLAGIVGNPVVVDDRAHEVVELEVSSADPSDVLADWRRHSRSGHAFAPATTAGVTTSTDPACCWSPVIVNGALWGRVHVLPVHRKVDAIDQVAIDRAAAAIGLALLGERTESHTAAQRRKLLIEDVERRRISSGPAFLQRAATLGADLTGKRLFAMLIAHDTDGLSPSIAAGLRAAARHHGVAVLAGSEGREVRVILGVAHTHDARSTVSKVASAVASGVDRHSRIGVSDEATVERLAGAFAEAEEAVRYARIRQESGPYFYSQLGLHISVVAAHERGQLAAFVEEELGAMLEHDTKSNSALIPTLRALVGAAGHKSRAAQTLHIQRRSLYFRIERIEALTERRLDRGEDIATLAFALHGLDLLHDRSAQRAGAV